jgi:hypothetical protein
MRTIAVLFARKDSIYKTMPNVDVYDAERDARTFQGGMPGIYHPPCRAWGSLSHFAKPRPGERRLAPWSIGMIRRHGGVLEHPINSRLRVYSGLPAYGTRDRWGGFLLAIDQDWFGHRAQKATFLYIVGVEPKDVPPIPIRLEEPEYVVSPSSNIRLGHPNYRPQLCKPEREATPLALAKWLVELARSCAHA